MTYIKREALLQRLNEEIVAILTQKNISDFGRGLAKGFKSAFECIRDIVNEMPGEDGAAHGKADTKKDNPYQVLELHDTTRKGIERTLNLADYWGWGLVSVATMPVAQPFPHLPLASDGIRALIILKKVAKE